MLRQFLGTLLLGSISAVATPVAGDLIVKGSFQVHVNSIDFFPLGGISGDFNVEPTSTGFFAGLVDSTDSEDGKITDLSEPVGTDISVLPFLTFDLRPDVVVELTRINDGIFAPCLATPSCSVNQFNFTRAGTSVVLNVGLIGNVVESGTRSGNLTGTLTSIFNDTTIAQLLLEIADVGFKNAPFDGHFTTASNPVPEPGTSSLLAAGGVLGALGAFLRARM